MEQKIKLISGQLKNSNVVFKVSKHMLRNSEMNATIPIREFLSNELIFDFASMLDAKNEYMECVILYNNQSILAKIRFGHPPNKREARFWIYGLNNYTKAEESILMTKLEDKLVIIPLNQEIVNLNNLKEISRSANLNLDTKRNLKKQKRSKKYKSFKKDHINQALLNTRLGLEGELFVVFLERQNLINLEREDLAILVEHKSVTDGDGLGYDILSFDSDGNEKYIEVKSTKGKCNTRFFISPNEIDFSLENENNYYLYRVYEFNESKKSGKIKVVKGNISNNIELEPNSFSGVINE
jgi:hypothetical protein|tara:strand:- start:240 stop:1130 length:891 start_codon:yes stop_codon:yes gene_type:complete